MGTLSAPSGSLNEIQTPVIPNEEAVFLGWQKTRSGEICFPLYTILLRDHPLYRSTVSEKTLRAQHIQIPRTPSPYPEVAPYPWQDLGTELANPRTAREAIEAAGLDFAVLTKPMKDFVMPSRSREVLDRWVTVRTDTGEILGIVEEGYEPIQNREAFAFFDNLVADEEATYETAGVLGGGDCIWVLARLPGFINVHGKDIVNKYLLLSNSHNGSSRVRVKIMPVRVVCSNTLTAPMQGAGDVQIHHTSNSSDGRIQALSLLGLTYHLYEQLDTWFNRMSLTQISDRQLLDYVNALVPDDEGEEGDTKVRETRKTFLDLYESGHGADLSRGTLWGAYNCVTEYTDHVMAGDPSTRLESIWFGGGDRLKLRAFQLAEFMMRSAHAGRTFAAAEIQN
jgi:phage/plasmid-like protein (TIGR03299 family)